MPRRKKSRTDYRPNDVDRLYTAGHISHIAESGCFLDPDLEDLGRHIKSAAKAYLDLVAEEVEKQNIRNQQARQREKRAKKGLKFEIVDEATLHVREPGRPPETSMRAFVSSLALIYSRHSGREPKGGSERRPDDHFHEFLWAACNPLFEFKFQTHEHFVRWYERERKKMKEEDSRPR